MKPNEIQAMVEEMKRGIDAEKRKLLLWSNGRLLTAFVVLVGLVLGFKNKWIVAFALAFLGAAAFCYFVHRFNLQNHQIALAQNRLVVAERYQARATGAWYDFADNGASFVKRDDYLSSDLDLFGPRSLYQYISVAHTACGRDALMRLLTRPNLSLIGQRQASVVELLQDDVLAVEFEALGIQKNKRSLEAEREAEATLRRYATGKGNTAMPLLTLFAYGMPILTAIAILGAVSGIGTWIVALNSVFLQIFSALLLAGKIAEEKDSVMLLAKKIAGIEERMQLMCKPDFKSAYLVEMQRQLGASAEGIRSLRRIVNAWQWRENFILYWPLVGLLAWDFNCSLALDKWRRKYGEAFCLWMDWLGEAEALYSLGTLSRVSPQDTTLPEILLRETPFLDMRDGKHPLLNPQTVVGNDYKQGADTVIITGSNMSGKSTFMRTLALNAVLAYAGGTVLAKEFRITPMRLFTSMRVRDDVSEGISSFYGEILRIKAMVEWADKEQPMLVLVDEIFRGTNSADRIIGAEAAIRKLSKPWMMTLVTTHDFELCALADSEQVRGKNFHFEEHYVNDEIAFDYKIRPGRCQTTNAQHLMRIAGLLDADTRSQEEEGAHVL